jgi:hypothetical protein
MRPRHWNPKASHLLLAIGLLVGFWPLIIAKTAHGLTLTSRSISVSTAEPSAVATHDFQFTYASTSPVGSIVFEYCDNSPLFTEPCNIPPGLNTLTASLVSQSGETGFAIDGVNTTSSRIVITRAPVATATIASDYVFSGITNPSTPSSAQYVRVSTHASTDGSGAETDQGGVAYAILAPFQVGAFVPPFLAMCAAVTVEIDCSGGNGNQIDLGTLVTSQPRSATSQFSGATNSITGLAVYSLGTTMTSGNNVIDALSSPTPSLPGFSQFGVNMRDNSQPNIGADRDGPGTNTPLADYNIPNFYRYEPGGIIASSTLPTDYTRMTVSYIVNINGNQKPGVYAATVTYLGLGQF